MECAASAAFNSSGAQACSFFYRSRTGKLPSDLFQRIAKRALLQRLRTQRPNGAAGLSKALTHELACEIKVASDVAGHRAEAVAQDLELDADAGKALGKGVVNFARHAVALGENRGKLRARVLPRAALFAQPSAGADPKRA